eukprot:TRINITY_DN9915_c0_g2_i1.p1 TRINITY_DN9915_c0_g2~~TRINITY_DN9915_c0_g2_i1.p1  ORF type:complete len:334 (+),score=42.28 TRINITY_DN9915_c0_g2_i1:70-1002(+)
MAEILIPMAYSQPGYSSCRSSYCKLEKLEKTAGSPEKIMQTTNSFVIKQRMNKLDIVSNFFGACMFQESRFSVYDTENGGKLLDVREKSSLCCRMFCSPRHPLLLEWSDPITNEQVMTTARPFRCDKCPAVSDSCRQQAFVFQGVDTLNGKLLGYSKQPKWGGVFVPTIEVFTENEQEIPFSVIEGHRCCFGGVSKLCCNQYLYLSNKRGKEADVGIVKKRKATTTSQAVKKLMTTADFFFVRFSDTSLSPQQKAVLLSSVLLLDYMLFETGKPWQCQPWRGRCSVVCVQCYLCGMLLPCQFPPPPVPVL